MTASYWRIHNWDKIFENNRTREYKKLAWVPVPNKHDGDGFTELMEDPEGVALYGAWVLIVEIASKCEPRGSLLREDGSAHTPQSLARISRGAARFFEAAIPKLLKIGWLESVPIGNEPDATISQDAAGISQDAAPRARAGALQFSSIPSVPFSSVRGESERGKAVNALSVHDARLRLCVMFRRAPSDPWSYAEDSTLGQLIRERPSFDSELSELLTAHAKNGQFFPRSIQSLLDGWTKTLDSIRNPNYGIRSKPQGSLNPSERRAERRSKEFPQTLPIKEL